MTVEGNIPFMDASAVPVDARDEVESRVEHDAVPALSSGDGETRDGDGDVGHPSPPSRGRKGSCGLSPRSTLWRSTIPTM